MKTIVIALGGNAILNKGEKPTAEVQAKNVKKAVKNLAKIIKDNHVIIAHGNGPQAGYLLLQQKEKLDIIDAETEGEIGYLIQKEIYNAFKKTKSKKGVATVLTQVLVDKKDPSLKNPTKFVGQFYSEKEAKKLSKKFKIKKDSNRGYRRVVASPKPIKIIEHKVIRSLLHSGAIVIAAGGGGIPVIEDSGKLKGVEAVVDKDLASSCLASLIKADELIIITDVDGAYLNYGTSREKKLAKVNLKDLKKYYLQGHFHPGSMGPKIEAAISFLQKGGKKVIITNIENINNEKRGTAITR